MYKFLENVVKIHNRKNTNRDRLNHRETTCQSPEVCSVRRLRKLEILQAFKCQRKCKIVEVKILRHRAKCLIIALYAIPFAWLASGAVYSQSGKSIVFLH